MCVCFFFLNQEQRSFQAVRLQELTPLLVLTGAPWLLRAARCAVPHLCLHLIGATGCLGIATWVECGVMPEMGAAMLSWGLDIPGLCSQH